MSNSSSTPATFDCLSGCCIKRIMILAYALIPIVLWAFIFFFIGALFVHGLYPKAPHFQVESLSLTDFISSKSMAGRWQVGILVKNSHKNLAINYNTLESTVYYHNVLLSKSLLMPFRQGSLSETTLNITLSAIDIKVEPFVSDGINRERERGLVRFDVRVAGSIWFGPRKGFNVFPWRRTIHVLCSGVVVNISSNDSSGNSVGGATNCQVHHG